MKKKKKQYKKPMSIAIKKLQHLEYWEKKSKLISISEENRSVIVNYILWHIWSTIGIVKFCNALYFYLTMKLAKKGITISDEELMTVWVDYEIEKNDYDRTGLVEMVCFSPRNGFKVVDQ